VGALIGLHALVQTKKAVAAFSRQGHKGMCAMPHRAASTFFRLELSHCARARLMMNVELRIENDELED
jgi:hypothetical protein